MLAGTLPLEIGGAADANLAAEWTLEQAPAYSTDHLLIDADNQDNAERLLSLLAEEGFEVWQPYEFSPLLKVGLHAKSEEDLKLFERMVSSVVGDTARVERDRLLSISLESLPAILPDDGNHDDQWHLERIACPEAWAITQGSPDVIVAIIDSGLSNWSGEFDGRILDGYNFADDNEDWTDKTGHGTAVASVLAARGNNGQYVAGVDWNCMILPVKVLDVYAPSQFESVLAAAIDFSVARGARVINISLGLAVVGPSHPPCNEQRTRT